MHTVSFPYPSPPVSSAPLLRLRPPSVSSAHFASFLPVNALPMLLRAFRTAVGLAGAFDVEERSAKWVAAYRRFAGIDKLPPQDRI
jgi:hypothetical protein